MRNESYKLLDMFDNAYWSGKSGSLFINEYFVDEIVQFNYQLTENTAPVYHHMSFTPVFLKGVRIIQGEFAINYKQDHFIFTMLEMIRRGYTSTSNSDVKETMAIGARTLKPELSVVNEAGKSLTTAQRIKEGHKLRRIKSNYISSLDSAYDEFKYTASSTNPALFAPFDMTLRFGYSVGEGVVLKLNQSGNFVKTYKPGTTDLFTMGTGCRIMNTVLTSRTLRVNDAGQPTLEVYTFMAADLQPLNKIDETVTKPTSSNLGLEGPSAIQIDLLS